MPKEMSNKPTPKLYVIIIPNEERDQFEEVVNRIDLSSCSRRRVKSTLSSIDGKHSTIYSVELLDNEVTILKLSIQGSYECYTGDPRLLWNRIVILSILL